MGVWAGVAYYFYSDCGLEGVSVSVLNVGRRGKKKNPDRKIGVGHCKNWNSKQTKNYYYFMDGRNWIKV